jgi:hypothetical protein
MAMESYHPDLMTITSHRQSGKLLRTGSHRAVRGSGGRGQGVQDLMAGELSVTLCTARACSLSEFGVDRRGNLAVFQKWL